MIVSLRVGVVDSEGFACFVSGALEEGPVHEPSGYGEPKGYYACVQEFRVYTFCKSCAAVAAGDCAEA